MIGNKFLSYKTVADPIVALGYQMVIGLLQESGADPDFKFDFGKVLL